MWYSTWRHVRKFVLYTCRGCKIITVSRTFAVTYLPFCPALKRLPRMRYTETELWNVLECSRNTVLPLLAQRTKTALLASACLLKWQVQEFLSSWNKTVVYCINSAAPAKTFQFMLRRHTAERKRIVCPSFRALLLSCERGGWKMI